MSNFKTGNEFRAMWHAGMYLEKNIGGTPLDYPFGYTQWLHEIMDAYFTSVTAVLR